MRVDSKSMIGEDIPDSQANVTQLLAECFDLAYELRTQAEEETGWEANANDAMDVK